MTAMLLVGCNNTNPGSGGGSGSSSAGAGGSGNAATGNTIPVGAYLSKTGDDATFGQDSENGIELALDKIKESGGINGKQIDLKVENDESATDKAASVVQKLITEDKVVAVIGEVASSRSLAAAPICQSNKVPMISPSSTNVKVTQQGDYIFRVCFIDPFQGYVAAKFAAGDKLHAKTAALFTDNASAYSIDFANEFKKDFTQMGGTIVAEASYASSDTDFKGQLTKFQAANPDVILIPGYYKSVGAIGKQARELGIKSTLLGGDGWDSQDLFVTGGDSLEGSYFSDHMDINSSDPTVSAFRDAFQKKYGADHKPGSLTALAYDATMILADAMKRAKTLDGPGIRDALAQTKDFKGVTGNITINADRNADKPAVILTVKDHGFQYVETIQHP
jgi:branched-chain amino acid transport system substrate-binding protein